MIHGILLLLGQGDKSAKEAAEMRKKEDEALAVWNTIV
jgi:ssRNA-specific RNase YbeY (16S rRNA maturation enzyme)